MKHLTMAALFATAAYVLKTMVERERSRLRDPERRPAPTQTWEGEGGALPVTGAQMGPNPS